VVLIKNFSASDPDQEIDSASDADHEYMYILYGVGNGYILSDESSMLHSFRRI